MATKNSGGGYVSLWRHVIEQLGATQAAQADALGVTQQAIARKLSGAHKPAQMDRWLLALGAAAMLEPPVARMRIIERARELQRMAEEQGSEPARRDP